MELQQHFEVIHSNDMDELARICAGIMQRHPLADPFSSEKILIMNFGMRTYLSQELAVLNDISAHCDFMPLWTFIWEIFRAVCPGADKINRFSRDYLAWTLLSMQDKWTNPTGTDGKIFERMREYIAGDKDGSMAWELCSRVADTLDQYQMYRPDWIIAWNSFQDEDFAMYAKSLGTGAAGGRVRQWINRCAASVWSAPRRTHDAPQNAVQNIQQNAQPNAQPNIQQGVQQNEEKARKHRILILEENVWQLRLWQLLRGQLEPKEYKGGPLDNVARATALMDRAQVLEALCGILSRDAAGALPGIPERVFIFGVSALPQQVLVFLQALSRHSQIYFMFLNPCQEYWGDLNSGAAEDFEKFRRCCRDNGAYLSSSLRTGRQIRDFCNDTAEDGAVSSSAYDDEGHRVEGNPLLLGLGRQGMDSLSMLLELDPAPDFIGAFVERSGGTMLEELQNRLLRLDEGNGKKYLIKEDDLSLQIRSCHTRLREVEVLHDALLALFADYRDDAAAAGTDVLGGEGGAGGAAGAGSEGGERGELGKTGAGEVLLPRQILVMVPNIEEYAAYFEAVFGGVPKDSPCYIPYSIGDRSSACASETAEAVLKLLSIGERRFNLSLFSELLSFPVISRKFGISQDEVDVLCSWCTEAGIHWGLDDHDTRKLSEFPLPWTFEHGIERMLDGYMLGSDCGGAYPEIEGHEDAQLLGKFWDFIKALRELRDDFYPRLKLGDEKPGDESRESLKTANESGESLNVRQWAQKLNEKMLRRFLAPGKPEDHQDYGDICEIIHGMEDISGQLKQPPKITLPVFSSMLSEALGKTSGRSRYLESAVSICSLIPMRTVPFKHIFILGLNDGEFPRRPRGPGFNLMGLQGFFRRGDRSRAIDDRYLFLEALLAAERSIYFSYLGESPNDQSELNPSPVLSELLEYLEDNFEVEGSTEPSREAVKKRLLRHEHMSASDPDNFREHRGYVTNSRDDFGTIPVRPSFDADSFIPEGGAVVPREYPGQFRDWGICPEEKIDCSAEDLIRFFSNPSRFFLRRNFKITLRSSVDEQRLDDEIFIPQELEFRRMLDDFLGYRDETELKKHIEQLQCAGVFPAGIFGENLSSQLLENWHRIQQALEAAGIAGEGKAVDYNSGERTIDDGSGRKVLMCFVGSTQRPALIFQPYSEIEKLKDDVNNPDARYFTAAHKFLEALVRSLASTLAGAGDGSVYICDCKGGLWRFKGFASLDETQKVLDKVLGFYLSGFLKPFPLSRKMLEATSVEEEAFEYDKDARLLFGSPKVITNNPELNAEFEQFKQFYLDEVTAKVEKVEVKA